MTRTSLPPDAPLAGFNPEPLDLQIAPPGLRRSRASRSLLAFRRACVGVLGLAGVLASPSWLQATSDSPLQFFRQFNASKKAPASQRKPPVVRRLTPPAATRSLRLPTNLPESELVPAARPPWRNRGQRRPSPLYTASPETREYLDQLIVRSLPSSQSTSSRKKSKDSVMILMLGRYNALATHQGLDVLLKTNPLLGVVPADRTRNSIHLPALKERLEQITASDSRLRYVVYFADATDYFPYFGLTERGAVPPIGLSAYRDHVGTIPTFPRVAFAAALERVRAINHALLTMLQRSELNVMIVGLPPLADPVLSNISRAINIVVETAADEVGFRFVDLWPILTDNTRNFTFNGAALDGRIQPIREEDGIGFTRFGRELVANRIKYYIEESLGIARSVESAEIGEFISSSNVLPPFVRNQPVPITLQYVETNGELRTIESASESRSTTRVPEPNQNKPGRADYFLWSDAER